MSKLSGKMLNGQTSAAKMVASNDVVVVNQASAAAVAASKSSTSTNSTNTNNESNSSNSVSQVPNSSNNQDDAMVNYMFQQQTNEPSNEYHQTYGKSSRWFSATAGTADESNLIDVCSTVFCRTLFY